MGTHLMGKLADKTIGRSDTSSDLNFERSFFTAISTVDLAKCWYLPSSGMSL